MAYLGGSRSIVWMNLFRYWYILLGALAALRASRLPFNQRKADFNTNAADMLCNGRSGRYPPVEVGVRRRSSGKNVR